MTLYDSSVLIDYLDGDEAVVEYVETRRKERALTPPLALFEVYQGEVFKTGPPDFEAVDRALGWITVTDGTAELARVAAEIQTELRERGESLAARDAYIAGTAKALGEPLATTDSDFDLDGIGDVLRVEFPRRPPDER